MHVTFFHLVLLDAPLNMLRSMWHERHYATQNFISMGFGLQLNSSTSSIKVKSLLDSRESQLGMAYFPCEPPH